MKATSMLSHGQDALLSVTMENVRSYRDEVQLSFLATRMAEAGAARPLAVAGSARSLAVLPAVGVFGANASGKTAILESLDDMRVIVVGSFRQASPGSRIFRRPFLLDEASRERPSRFEIELLLAGVRWQYGFEIDDHRVLGEYAYYFPRGRQAKVFDRERESVDFGQVLRSEASALRKPLRDNVLMLSIAGAFGTAELIDLHKWFEDSLQFASSHNRVARVDFTAHLAEPENQRNRVLSLLRYADLGVTDLHREPLPPEAVERLKQAMKILHGSDNDAEADDDYRATGVIQMTHSTASGEATIPPSDESLGTQVWLSLVGPVLIALDGGSVLLVDELDASLHPRLVQKIIRLFQNERTNPHCAQLVFNSHDTSILGDSERRTLGRDQVWFSSKDADGSTSLYALTEFSPRRDDAVERRYLQGRYGAVPTLNPAEIERALVGLGS